MPITDPESIVTEKDLAAFYQGIRPYLTKGGKQPPPQPIVYGIHIIANESDPDSKVEYLEDCVGFTPAHMDYTNDVFDYGSWENAFFMPKPCMLKYDGTVDYYLNPNDYTKKSDGTASDVASTSYGGNAMMEWPKIWLKIVPDTTKSNYEANIYISDTKIDEDYTDWPYHNSAGESMDHFYTPIYNGSLISSKLRSISGQAVSNNKTAQQEWDYARANNPTGSLIWNIEVEADVTLINILLMLISKSTDAQAKFGMGLTESGSQAILNAFRTGVHNTKGLFYGTNSGTASTYTNVVKVFGMENWWGYQFRRYLGHMLINGVQTVKKTYGQEDGTTVTDYNLTGNGYKTADSTSPSGSSSGAYLKFIKFTEDGMYPEVTGGTSSTYYPDMIGFNNSGTCFPFRGGYCNDGVANGPFFVYMGIGTSFSGWHVGSALSAKPLQ